MVSRIYLGFQEFVHILGTMDLMLILQFALWEFGVRSRCGNELLNVYTPIHALGSWSPFALWERIIEWLSCVGPVQPLMCWLAPELGFHLVSGRL